MQSQIRKSYYFSFAKFVFIGEPYRITANEIFIEKIYVVCGQKHLRGSIAVRQKYLYKISQQFVMYACFHFVNGNKSISL